MAESPQFPPALPTKPMDPIRPSLRVQAAKLARAHPGWAPAALGVGLSVALGALVPVVTAWRAPDLLAAQKGVEQFGELKAEISALRIALQSEKDARLAAQIKLVKWTRYVDADLCKLGALFPYGCADVSFQPAPLGRKGPHPIQPSLGPLDRLEATE